MLSSTNNCDELEWLHGRQCTYPTGNSHCMPVTVSNRILNLRLPVHMQYFRYLFYDHATVD